MLAQYRELFAQVRKRPGMFGVKTYRETVAFVEGCDAATGRLLLEGFHEWMQMRLGSFSSFGWPGIVLSMTVPGWDEHSPRQPAEPDEVVALDRAFDMLDDFLAVRAQRDGLKRLYREYHVWEQVQIGEIRRRAAALPAVVAETPAAVSGSVWIFHGDGAPFASGVFADQASGLEWAGRHALTGILTEYHVGDGCYDRAVVSGRFTPSKPHHGLPGHVAQFGPGGAHVHITNGQARSSG